MPPIKKEATKAAIYEDEEERKRRKRMEMNFIGASEVKRMTDERIAYVKSVALRKNNAAFISSLRRDKKIEKAVTVADASLSSIQLERERSADRVQKMIEGANNNQNDEAVYLVTHLQVTLHAFSQTTDRTAAAKLSQAIAADLKRLKEDRGLLLLVPVSNEMMQQAEEAINIGMIYETSLAAIQMRCLADAGRIKLTSAEMRFCTGALFEADMCNPSDILEIHSPELDALETKRRELASKKQKEPEAQKKKEPAEKDKPKKSRQENSEAPEDPLLKKVKEMPSGPLLPNND